MKLLTVTEAAEYLRLGESTVYQLLSDGLIAGFRVGPRKGGIRISEADLLAYLDSCRIEGPKERPSPSQKVKLRHLR